MGSIWTAEGVDGGGGDGGPAEGHLGFHAAKGLWSLQSIYVLFFFRRCLLKMSLLSL